MTEEDLILQQVLNEEEELTEKQKKIIIAAIESFSEKGFAATSTSEIAKKAGVAEGTIFRHYKTKKELLISIVTPVMAKLLAPFIIKDLNKVLDRDFEKFEDFLRAMIENRKKFLKNNFAIFKILVQEIPFQPELREQFLEHIAKKTFGRFAKLVEHYQAKGQIIEMPSASAVRLAASAIIGYLLINSVFGSGKEWDDEAEIERTIEFIMHGISKKE
ncbi:TetR/AcrR family transcriptional regulator [Neobacillus terrae]|uniref:TetR/AcrR family transcriptional regulator n=1 Tax=Neobacillus terrae TaxID=3034837 RepID=UPI00140C6709|nr:TetR/AcrR family transcriptional regulator [Neobacillus terrae]NHM30170.1 TetR/AcrR family transcriptional regulator [Neobacillus terrae]